MATSSRPPKPRPVHVLRRGDINQPLAEAAPGALSCLEGLTVASRSRIRADEAARRAALARWLVDPKNVLTWRSIVNRVWHYHFGRGICDTPNDLGKMGGQPSHPELLDWLAVEFRDGGGSLKKLHRLIVTSAAYRAVVATTMPSDAKVDADNRLLWRMNRTRLDAECIRDGVLAISGKLDLTMGGPSVKQFIQIAGHPRHADRRLPELRRRQPGQLSAARSTDFLFRTLPDPFMESMDCPDASQSAPVRAQSVTALQALSMLNNRFMVRQSEHMAAAIDEAGVRAARATATAVSSWRLSRDPTAEEAQRWPAYADKHGLANACRLMFNTNEFVFVN